MHSSSKTAMCFYRPCISQIYDSKLLIIVTDHFGTFILFSYFDMIYPSIRSSLKFQSDAELICSVHAGESFRLKQKYCFFLRSQYDTHCKTA